MYTILPMLSALTGCPSYESAVNRGTRKLARQAAFACHGRVILSGSSMVSYCTLHVYVYALYMYVSVTLSWTGQALRAPRPFVIGADGMDGRVGCMFRVQCVGEKRRYEKDTH